MKLSTFLSLGLSTIALAAPTPTTEEKRGVLAKRASVTDTPSAGFATQNGGTTGGKGGSTTTVSTFAQFTAAVADDTARIVMVSGPISSTGNVKIGSNKSIIGKSSAAKLTGFTLTVKSKKNVIIRNLSIAKVVGGDAIAVQLAQNVWIDHCDLSSDMDHDKDYYDGLLDLTHAADFITVSNTYFHDHWKCSLVGHSDSNADEDTGHLRVTYHNNYWKNINSRGPSIRFGTGHIFNNYYENVADGINTRDGAQVLVQNNVFVNSKKPLYSTDDGYAVASGNDFGGASNEALAGTLNTAPYTVPTLLAASAVKDAVVGSAGATLSF
ncbi:pectin lyase-like protein [Lindgomyces ingoldianus]|uniref:Pectin lyase-like protein n=1 Tax=Lindgomyces ingoldianus TaxID=673940 RepID=A0ACB6QX75_9PLEO|nr:pectin lyase-like protein [Lindgomyces ingoldianus]KAF2471407.1 pectin lyase-like protein [Lindgomyces ingoldianus]